MACFKCNTSCMQSSWSWSLYSQLSGWKAIWGWVFKAWYILKKKLSFNQTVCGFHQCIEVRVWWMYSNLCSINLKMMWWRRSNANLLFERNFKKIVIAIARDLIASIPNIFISMIMTLIPALAKGYVPTRPNHSSNHIHLIPHPFFITLWYLSLLVSLIKVTASFQ